MLAAMILAPVDRAAAQEYAFWYADIFSHPYGQPASSFVERRDQPPGVLEVRASVPNSFDLRGTLKVTMPETIQLSPMKPKILVTVDAQVTLAQGTAIENVSIQVNANLVPASKGVKTDFGAAKTYHLNLQLPMELDIAGIPDRPVQGQDGRSFRDVSIGFSVTAGQAGASASAVYFYLRQ